MFNLCARQVSWIYLSEITYMKSRIICRVSIIRVLNFPDIDRSGISILDFSLLINFHYTKNSIEIFLCNTWDRRLKWDSSLFFQSTMMNIDTSAIRDTPLIQRHEKRKNNVQYLNFIHGKLARFKDFRKRVGIDSNGICEDCNID